MQFLRKLKEVLLPDREPPKLFAVEAKYPGMPTPTAAFHARLIKIKDGDTQDYELNKHHGDKSEKTVRLLGVDTREVTGKERINGLLDKEFVAQWIKYAKDNCDTEWAFIVQTVAKEKYGRELGWVWRTCDGECLNIDLVTSGHFKPGPATADAFTMKDLVATTEGL